MSEIIIGELCLPLELRDYLENIPCAKKFRLEMLKQIEVRSVDEQTSED
jgi:hypothetical protein